MLPLVLFVILVAVIIFDIGFAIGKRFEFGAAPDRDQKVLALKLRQMRRDDIVIERIHQFGLLIGIQIFFENESGVNQVVAMQRTWEKMQRYVDPERYAKAATFLEIQHREAQWWRDASIAYFQSKSHLPLPAGEVPPAHSLAYYEALRFPHAPGI